MIHSQLAPSLYCSHTHTAVRSELDTSCTSTFIQIEMTPLASYLPNIHHYTVWKTDCTDEVTLVRRMAIRPKHLYELRSSSDEETSYGATIFESEQLSLRCLTDNLTTPSGYVRARYRFRSRIELCDRRYLNVPELGLCNPLGDERGPRSSHKRKG